MYKPVKTIKGHVIQLAKERGFTSLTDFINDWIKSGGTFSSLRVELRIKYDVDFYITAIWKSCRPYLTIPYTPEDQFWYRWDSVARAKGFRDANHMIKVFQHRKYVIADYSEELGVIRKNIPPLVRRLAQERVEGKVVPKRSYRSRVRFIRQRDKDGIVKGPDRAIWRQKLDGFGFKSLREAVWKLKRKGLNYHQMAQIFGVSDRCFRQRRLRAGLAKPLFPREQSS